MSSPVFELRTVRLRPGLVGTLALALAGMAGAASAAELAERFPAGAQVYLEVADPADLVARSERAGQPLAALKGTQIVQAFVGSKIGRKAGARLERWLKAAAPEAALGAVARSLLGPRVGVAIYDIERMRFLWVVEGAAPGLEAAVLAKAGAKASVVELGQAAATVIGEGPDAFYLGRAGDALVVGNDPAKVEAALQPSGPATSLGADPAHALFARLPAGRVRASIAARTFSTVYMRSYWIGGSGHLPPAEPVATCVRQLRNGDLEELRLTTLSGPAPSGGVLPPAPQAPSPPWTYRAAGFTGQGDDQLLDLLDAVLPTPQDDAETDALGALAQRLESAFPAGSAFGLATGVTQAAAPVDLGPQPEGSFLPGQDPLADLAHRARGALVLAVAPGGTAPGGREVAGWVAAYLGQRLGAGGGLEVASKGPGRYRVVAPLYADLGPWVVEREGAIFLVDQPGGAPDVDAYASLQAAASGQLEVAEVDLQALRADVRAMKVAAEGASSWLTRQASGFADEDLLAVLEGPLAQIRRVVRTRAPSAEAPVVLEDRVHYSRR